MYKYEVTLKHYQRGSGYSHEETIDSGVTAELFPASSWNYQDNPIASTDDTWYEVMVEFYAADADSAIDDPIHTDRAWIE